MAYSWLIRIGAAVAIIAGAWGHGWYTRDASCALDAATKTIEVANEKEVAHTSVKRLPTGDAFRVLQREWKR